MNAFLQLREQDLTAFSEQRSEVVRERVERSLHRAELAASIIELFGPVLADTLTVLSGATVEELAAAGHLPGGASRTQAGPAPDDEPYGPGFTTGA